MHPTIQSSVSEIFANDWNITNGAVVPKTEDVILRNGGKSVEATYLYADLAESSKLAQTLTPLAAGKIIKAYVNTATRILRHTDGHIRSFDGDRVMAIYMGAHKEERAVRAALGINWAVEEVIRPAIRTGFTDGEDFHQIRHGIGIDSGDALIIRGGIRDNNDLISIGASPNVAAKLSDIRSWQGPIYITGHAREQLGDAYQRFDDTGDPMWVNYNGAFDVGGVAYPVWATSGIQAI